MASMLPMLRLDPAPSRSPGEPLWHLCYRYWFWGWLFIDVTQGDRLRRTAAWKHNVRQRVHLTVYMRRWGVCVVAMLALGHALNLAASPAMITAAFFVTAAIAVVIVFVAVVAWTLLAVR